LLPNAEYACNNSINQSTGKTPFEMVYRFEPEMRMNLAREAQAVENAAAKDTAERMAESIEANKQMWKEAQVSMARYYDKKHKKFDIAAMVFVSCPRLVNLFEIAIRHLG
jgi:hypothetical protein